MAQYDPIAIKSGIPTVLGTDTLRDDRVAIAGMTTTGLTAGDVCQVSGALTLSKASNGSASPVVGVYDGISGSVVRRGVVVATFKSGLTLANGDAVYLSSTAGALTNVKPTSDKVHEVGVVLSASDYASPGYQARILLQPKPVVTMATSVQFIGSSGALYGSPFNVPTAGLGIQTGDFGVLTFASAWTASDVVTNNMGWTWVDPGAMYTSASDSNVRFGMFAGVFSSVPANIVVGNARGNSTSLHLVVYRGATSYTSATKLNTYPMPNPMLFPSMNVPSAGAWVLAFNGNQAFTSLPTGAAVLHQTYDGGHGWGQLSTIHRPNAPAGATGVLSFGYSGGSGYEAAIAIVLQP